MPGIKVDDDKVFGLLQRIIQAVEDGSVVDGETMIDIDNSLIALAHAAGTLLGSVSPGIPADVVHERRRAFVVEFGRAYQIFADSAARGENEGMSVIIKPDETN